MKAFRCTGLSLVFVLAAMPDKTDAQTQRFEVQTGQVICYGFDEQDRSCWAITQVRARTDAGFTAQSRFSISMSPEWTVNVTTTEDYAFSGGAHCIARSEASLEDIGQPAFAGLAEAIQMNAEAEIAQGICFQSYDCNGGVFHAGFLGGSFSPQRSAISHVFDADDPIVAQLILRTEAIGLGATEERQPSECFPSSR